MSLSQIEREALIKSSEEHGLVLSEPDKPKVFDGSEGCWFWDASQYLNTWKNIENFKRRKNHEHD